MDEYVSVEGRVLGVEEIVPFGATGSTPLLRTGCTAAVRDQHLAIFTVWLLAYLSLHQKRDKKQQI